MYVVRFVYVTVVGNHLLGCRVIQLLTANGSPRFVVVCSALEMAILTMSFGEQ